MYCSAHDLVRFGMFHLKVHCADQKAILSDATIDAMQQRTTPGEGWGYGVGWGLMQDEYGYRTVGHGGGMGGVSTQLMMVPSEGLAVVALANAESPLPFLVVDEILDALLPIFAERRARQHAEQNQQSQPPTIFVPPAELLGMWKGNVSTYAGEMPFTLTFQPDGDVHARLGEQLITLVNQVVFAGNHLDGELWGDIGTADARRQSHKLQLDLTLRDGALNGAVVAIPTLPDGEGGASGRRVGNALASWAELRRSPL